MIKEILFYDLKNIFKRKSKKKWWQLRKPLRLRILEYNKRLYRNDTS